MYPVNLNISGKISVVIGGGPVALRKVQGILKGGGEVRLISPRLVDGLAALVSDQMVQWWARPYQPGDLAGALLVFAATSDPGVQQQIRGEAEERGLLINLADDPQGSGFHVPATVHRGDLTLAVSTNGRSPALAAMVRARLEEMFGEEYGLLLAHVGAMRTRALQNGGSGRMRDLFDDRLVELIQQGDWQKAITALADACTSSSAPSPSKPEQP